MTAEHAEPPKVLLVSIEKYDHSPLDYAQSDVKTLAGVFMTRYGATAQACIDWDGDSPDLAGDGAKRSIMQKIETWCNDAKFQDTAILYLAGHGVKDTEGKLYLAMINFNNKNFDTGAIEFSWIRERFAQCEAKNKLLLVDTCFAGTSKNIDFEQASMEEVNKSFGEMKDVVTIASSQAGEKSWLWGKMKHSLYTYWLIEGFKGHADSDSDRIITPDELLRYLQEQVSWIAKRDLDQEQTPTMLNEQAGKEIKMSLRAGSLEQLIDDIATQIDLLMQFENFPYLGIPEFTTGTGNQIEPQYGVLPRNIADMLRKSLVIKAQKHRTYQVISDNSLQDTLKSNDLTPEDLGTDKTKSLKIESVEVPVLLSGCISFFEPTGINVQAGLLNLKENTKIGQFGGIALLSPANMAMAGISGKFSVRKPSMTYHDNPVHGLISTAEKQDMDQIEEERRAIHPLADSNNPFKISFQTRPANSKEAYKKAELKIAGNDCCLPLEKGTEYKILIENNSGELVFGRILVDGLNTVSQQMTTKAKGAVIEKVDSEEGELEVAPRVLLEEARAWVFAPKTSYTIPGFFDANGVADTMRRFQIVDADESVAARKKYTEQIGLITIAFFKAVPKEKRSGIGTGMSQTIERVKVPEYKGDFEPGNMIVAYNIRYMTPKAMNEAIAKKKEKP